mmetsp:Transcript_61047/g.114917  ORF Transcript_61047/g.114917 Transcript_61047/m.114917 type:complete len:260 (+) Transcript_61047:51-830(+)
MMDRFLAILICATPIVGFISPGALARRSVSPIGGRSRVLASSTKSESTAVGVSQGKVASSLAAIALSVTMASLSGVGMPSDLGAPIGSSWSIVSPAFADDDDSVYTADPFVVSDQFEDQIDASMARLKEAKTQTAVLTSMGSMAEAVGINNADGEMNVFGPSYRRAKAEELAVIKAAASKGDTWDNSNVADFYGFMKRQFDPYHTIELKGYLGVAPFLGGAVYLALIFAQRSFSSQFTPAYIAGAAVVFGPIAALYFFA